MPAAEAGLWPDDDIEAEAQTIAWMSFIASTLHPARRQGVDHTMAVWGLAERRLGGRQWAVGRYSIADIHLFRLFWRFRNSAGLSNDAFPHLSAHHDRMIGRPAVQRVIAIESQIGYELPA